MSRLATTSERSRHSRFRTASGRPSTKKWPRNTPSCRRSCTSWRFLSAMFNTWLIIIIAIFIHTTVRPLITRLGLLTTCFWRSRGSSSSSTQIFAENHSSTKQCTTTLDGIRFWFWSVSLGRTEIRAVFTSISFTSVFYPSAVFYLVNKG